MARRHTVDDFIIKSLTKHSNKYSYNNVIYINSRTKVNITCPIHGDFLQAPADHLVGCGCKSCKHEKIVDLKRKIYLPSYLNLYPPMVLFTITL